MKAETESGIIAAQDSGIKNKMSCKKKVLQTETYSKCRPCQ